MTEPSGRKARRRSLYAALAVVVLGPLAFFANVDGSLGLFERVFGGGAERAEGSDDGDALSAGIPEPPPTAQDDDATTAAGSRPEPSRSAETPVAETSDERTNHIDGDPAQQVDSVPQITEGWYNLTAYRSVDWGNGHYAVDSIRIGSQSFPNSIRGSYSSSASDPNNRRTWLVGGACTKLSVWVGKDASSTRTAGTGWFFVQAEGVEIHSTGAAMSDDPEHIELDVSGVTRLTLLDTRARQDANNAWGNPRVYCTAPPGDAR